MKKLRKYYVLENEQIIGTFSERLLTEKDRAEVSAVIGVQIVDTDTVLEEVKP